MAKRSGSRLTKYVSATTVLTADVANSLYGGLYGTSEGDSYNENDPVVAGHVHDGLHKDGHAQKINLEDHVDGQLQNENLADSAVTKRNVQGFLTQSDAIPEYEVIDGSTYYYLDLSDIRTEIANNGAFLTASNITSNTPGDLGIDDFVFGSDSLDDDGNTDHDNRIIFDKSKGAFRAGKVASTQWNNVNRGDQSVAFGLNNTAAGEHSAVVGGELNTVNGSSSNSFIGAGSGNIITGDSAAIVCGTLNFILTDSNDSFIGSGGGNVVANSDYSSIVSGNLNLLGSASYIARRSIIGSGSVNLIGQNEISDNSGILSGNQNTIDGNYNIIGSGRQNTITADDSIVVGGYDNETRTDTTAIVGGQSNFIDGSSENSVIVAGINNSIGLNADPAANSFIGGGNTNKIGASSGSGKSIIVGGYLNNVDGFENTIVGGTGNTIDVGSLAYGNFIGSGGALGLLGNEITGLGASCSTILNGRTNLVDIAIGNPTGGAVRTSEGGGATSALRNMHSILGGSDNTISTTGGLLGLTTGGELGLIVSGARNEINDSEGIFTSNTILNGFNCLIEAERYNQILNGYEHQIIGGGDHNTITSGSDCIINGGSHNIVLNAIDCNINGTSSYNTIINSDGCDIENDKVIIMMGKGLVGYSYNSIYSGGGPSAEHWSATCHFGGRTSLAATEYYLFLNDKDDETDKTIVSGERFMFNPLAVSSGVVFIGEYIGIGTESPSTTRIVAGTIYRAGEVASGGITWSTTGLTAADHVEFTPDATTFWSTGKIRFISTSGEVLVEVEQPASWVNFNWTVRTRVIYAV